MPYTQFINKPVSNAFTWQPVFSPLESRWLVSLSANIADKRDDVFSIWCQIGISTQDNVDTFAAILAQGYVTNEMGISWTGRIFMEPGSFLFNQLLSRKVVDVLTSVITEPL